MRTAAWVCLLAAAGSLVGAQAARQPVVAVALLILVCGAGYAVAFSDALPRAFLGFLSFVLLGYAFFDRAFAYVGVPPLFIGEPTLVFGIVACLASGSLLALGRSVVAWLIVALAVAGAAATLPYLGAYRIDALRDAALWGYGTFAFTVAACVISTRSAFDVLRWYRRWALPFVVWVAVATVLGRIAPGLLWPGIGIPVFQIKAGDAAVHLAGIAIAVLGGFGGELLGPRSTHPLVRSLFWLLWIVSVFLLAAINRGGFLAVVVALAIVGALEPAAIGKRLVGYGFVGITAAALLLTASLGIEGSRKSATDDPTQRSLSPSQVVENVISISGRQSAGDLSDTREWRLEWWRNIIEYTMFGPYFWTGKGFGVNLADDDGFQVAAPGDAPLRSPHNSFMTVLARMGVPGIGVWLLLQAGIGVSLLSAHLRARRAGLREWARLDLWILGYWSAFLVNSFFDVFLEGPQGGIWFWSLIGFGIAVVELQRHEIGRARLAWSAS